MSKITDLYTKKFHWGARLIFAAENLIIATASFLLGYYVTSSLDHSAPIIDGLWAIISGIMVWDTTPKKTIELVKNRVKASVIGAVIATAYLMMFDFHVVGFGVCIFIGVLFNFTFNTKEGIKPTGVTMAVILLISTINADINPMLNSSLRVLESSLGCVVAIAVSYIPIPPRYRFVK